MTTYTRDRIGEPDPFFLAMKKRALKAAKLDRKLGFTELEKQQRELAKWADEMHKEFEQ